MKTDLIESDYSGNAFPRDEMVKVGKKTVHFSEGAICCDCGKTLLKYENDTLCRSCFDQEPLKCDGCSEMKEINELEEVGPAVVCEACMKETCDEQIEMDACEGCVQFKNCEYRRIER